MIIADMQKDMFMHGAGEVLMERFLRMGIPLVDNWYASIF